MGHGIAPYDESGSDSSVVSHCRRSHHRCQGSSGRGSRKNREVVHYSPIRIPYHQPIMEFGQGSLVHDQTVCWMITSIIPYSTQSS